MGRILVVGRLDKFRKEQIKENHIYLWKKNHFSSMKKIIKDFTSIQQKNENSAYTPPPQQIMVYPLNNTPSYSSTFFLCVHTFCMAGSVNCCLSNFCRRPFKKTPTVYKIISKVFTCPYKYKNYKCQKI